MPTFCMPHSQFHTAPNLNINFFLIFPDFAQMECLLIHVVYQRGDIINWCFLKSFAYCSSAKNLNSLSVKATGFDKNLRSILYCDIL